MDFASVERPGSPVEHIKYDYLVVALGARLAYDKIEGFGNYGSTLSDTYHGNRLRNYLHGGSYKGGPIVIGSSRFHQGTKGKPLGDMQARIVALQIAKDLGKVSAEKAGAV